MGKPSQVTLSRVRWSPSICAKRAFASFAARKASFGRSHTGRLHNMAAMERASLPQGNWPCSGVFLSLFGNWHVFFWYWESLFRMNIARNGETELDTVSFFTRYCSDVEELQSTSWQSADRQEVDSLDAPLLWCFHCHRCLGWAREHRWRLHKHGELAFTGLVSS